MGLSDTYKPSLALLTDLYELTMAQGFWKLGRTADEAVFTLSFRGHPFRGGYTIAAGLANVVEYVTMTRFDETDRSYLATLRGADDQPLFDGGFLDYLGGLRFEVDVDAVPEGTAVFPQEPLVRVTGPLLQAQLLESPLLNLVGFQTLVATRAARICHAARGSEVLEFGLRRAQSVDGALAASRAAYIGGCAATSNVLAGRTYGIPVRGTHAHSWVMAFADEEAAFDAYADAMPNNCVFLVDTYDTLQGVRRAIAVGRRLRARGHELLGVRLDSGDLAYLSIEARRLLDDAGFEKTRIVASSDLDEHIIDNLYEQGAQVDVWGVGTRLATAYEQPALSAVYKLSALKGVGGTWTDKVKLSEQVAKTSNPGILQVRRYLRNGEFEADMIYDIRRPPADPPTIVHPEDHTRRKLIRTELTVEELLIPVVRSGRAVGAPPPLADVRQRTSDQLAALHPSVRRLLNPHPYPAGLELGLYEHKTNLILQARGI